MKPKLYGDGIHDDTKAIQAMLDSGISTVYLPVPKDKYLISNTLLIGSNTCLKLDQHTTVRLMDHSDCVMLRNKNRYTQDQNITIEGGIWDMNNLNQKENPLWYNCCDTSLYRDEKGEYTDVYFGSMMRFSHIKNFKFKNATFKDPVNFCLQMSNIEYFTIENLTFDFNHGNPHPVNMDGVHIDGGCRYGVVHNLQGACYDDLLALNADDCGAFDAIEYIEVDGIFSHDCHSAVRLLSTQSPVRNITISNLHGTYYQYAVGITYFYNTRDTRGVFENITLRDVYASKAPRHSFYMRDDQDVWSLILIQGRTDTSKLVLSNVNRIEETTPINLICLDPDAHVKNMSLTNVSQVNNTDGECPFILNNGTIDDLYMYNCTADKDEMIINNGKIGKKHIID